MPSTRTVTFEGIRGQVWLIKPGNFFCLITPVEEEPPIMKTSDSCRKSGRSSGNALMNAASRETCEASSFLKQSPRNGSSPFWDSHFSSSHIAPRAYRAFLSYHLVLGLARVGPSWARAYRRLTVFIPTSPVPAALLDAKFLMKLAGFPHSVWLPVPTYFA